MKKILFIIIIFTSLETLYAQYTAIPDVNFEQALINQGIDSDGIINGQVLTSDIVNVTDLVLQGLGINYLTGIEYFESLENLNCKYNNLSELNISSNLNIKELKCGGNPLSEIDLSNNTLLEVLYINVTDIEVLNLENNTGLIELQCAVNHTLENLNLSTNINLEKLYLWDNWSLATLDLSNNLNLTEFFLDNPPIHNLNFSTNTKLTSIYVTGIPNNIDFSHNTLLEELYCPNNLFTELDLSNNTALRVLYCGDVNIDFGLPNVIPNLDLSNNEELVYLNCNTAGVQNLNIASCTNLEFIDCSNNPLNSLDLSPFTNLEILECCNANLTELDVSSNIMLKELYTNNDPWLSDGFDWFHDNSISVLDLDNNTALERLLVMKNELAFLSLQNGNNTNMIMFGTKYNPNLTCIFVDDADYCEENWGGIDTTSTFVETQAACEEVAVEEQLLSLDIDIYPNPATVSFSIFNNHNNLDKVKIYNSLGKLVREFRQQEHYNISNLTTGVYTIHLNTKKGWTIKSLLVTN